MSVLGVAEDARPAIPVRLSQAAHAHKLSDLHTVLNTWAFYVIKGILSHSLSLAVDMVTKCYY